MYWGSGLSYNLTITTLPENYPGKNMLGKLLCEIRLLLRNVLLCEMVNLQRLENSRMYLYMTEKYSIQLLQPN